MKIHLNQYKVKLQKFVICTIAHKVFCTENPYTYAVKAKLNSILIVNRFLIY